MTVLLPNMEQGGVERGLDGRSGRGREALPSGRESTRTDDAARTRVRELAERVAQESYRVDADAVAAAIVARLSAGRALPRVPRS